MTIIYVAYRKGLLRIWKPAEGSCRAVTSRRGRSGTSPLKWLEFGVRSCLFRFKQLCLLFCKNHACKVLKSELLKFTCMAGGQKARLALAKDAYFQADVTLLDDPT